MTTNRNKNLSQALDLALSFDRDKDIPKIPFQNNERKTLPFKKSEDEELKELFQKPTTTVEDPSLTENIDTVNHKIKKEWKGKVSREDLEKEVIRQNTFGAKRWFVILFLIFIFGFLIFSFNFHIRQEVLKFKGELHSLTNKKKDEANISLTNKNQIEILKIEVDNSKKELAKISLEKETLQNQLNQLKEETSNIKLQLNEKEIPKKNQQIDKTQQRKDFIKARMMMNH